GSKQLDDVVPAIKERLEKPSEFQFSILDLPLLGRDREKVASSVEQWRGRTRAETFAERHHAGVAERHIRRYRGLAAQGVNAIYISPVGLTDPAELADWSEVALALQEVD
ncbi:MAG TPA: hypothetical protein VJ935_03590, partial [Acidimicrobiia bacterium]|nr:hypothetical protein [Acidimicrobiia bacterium]